jgi:uncharacterized metal-binding protein
LAYLVALELNRRGIAEMSCLAGVGAGKSHFLKQLKGREVWIIDGCSIECALGIFVSGRGGVDVHIRLHDFGIRKQAPVPTGEEFASFIDEVIRYIDAARDDSTSKTPACQAG